MDNIDIRKYIISNFKEDKEQDIRKSVEESVNSNEDDPLLGLGVFFELLWKNSNEDIKKTIISTIANSIKATN